LVPIKFRINEINIFTIMKINERQFVVNMSELKLKKRARS